MRRRDFALVAVAVVAAVVPASVQAQVRFDVTPHVGVFHPLNAMGPAAIANSAWYLRLDRMKAAPMLEITATVGWPARTLVTRFRGMITMPAEASGFFECYPGVACPAVLLPSTAEIDLMAGMADVVYTPFVGHRARPYAMLGAGLRRYHIEWPEAAVLVDEGSRSETTIAFHAGVGMEIDVPIGSVRAELAAYRSPRGAALDPPAGVGGSAAAGRRTQHDVAMTIGWRVFRF